jgi:hypothetical protein
MKWQALRGFGLKETRMGHIGLGGANTAKDERSPLNAGFLLPCKSMSLKPAELFYLAGLTRKLK